MSSLNLGRLLVLGLTGLMACEDEQVPTVPEPEQERIAHAALQDKDDMHIGYVMFTQTGEGPVGVSIIVLDGRTPGDHGVHIHEIGKCEPPDFMSAGDHWNPTMKKHGGPYAPEHHSGDFGNVTVKADGTGKAELVSDELSLQEGAPHSILGLSVIYHANADDLVTQMPPGNAGPRLGCGIITL
jgi:Cu-Zn family superoxide dismutase